MQLVKHICLNQKDAIAIRTFLEFLEGLDDECYDAFTQQIGCTPDFYEILDDFFEHADISRE